MSNSLASSLDAVLAAGVDGGEVPGVAAVVVDAAGTRYEGAFGERRLGGGDPMTVDTVGAIFSMTKPLTAAAAMQLVERGLLSLDAPAADVCPELGNVQVLTGFDPDGQPLTRPAASRVTLRQLLTHTSGFVYDIWNSDVTRWHEVTGVPTMAFDGRASLAAPLAFDPGTAWQYGIGIDWAGVVVEAASGQSLGAYLADNLTGPLGMTDTAFTLTSSMESRRSALHVALPDGSYLPVDAPPPERGAFESGGGGLHGTVTDYGRFIRMMLNDGELAGTRVLAPETVVAMSTNQIGDLRVTKLTTSQPNMSLDYELFEGVPKTWGLSFLINEAPVPTGCPVGTLRWAGLANSYFWIDRINGIGGASLSQILPFAHPAPIGLALEVEATVYAA